MEPYKGAQPLVYSAVLNQDEARTLANIGIDSSAKGPNATVYLGGAVGARKGYISLYTSDTDPGAGQPAQSAIADIAITEPSDDYLVEAVFCGKNPGAGGQWSGLENEGGANRPGTAVWALELLDAGKNVLASLQLQGKGTGTGEGAGSGSGGRMVLTNGTDSNILLNALDYASACKAISSSADNGAGLIRIVTAAAHGLVSDDYCTVAHHGQTSANGRWKVVRIDDTTIDLVGSTYVADGGATGGVRTGKYAYPLPFQHGLRFSIIVQRSGRIIAIPENEHLMHPGLYYSPWHDNILGDRCNKAPLGHNWYSSGGTPPTGMPYTGGRGAGYNDPDAAGYTYINRLPGAVAHIRLRTTQAGTGGDTIEAGYRVTQAVVREFHVTSLSRVSMLFGDSQVWRIAYMLRTSFQPAGQYLLTRAADWDASYDEVQFPSIPWWVSQAGIRRIISFQGLHDCSSDDAATDFVNVLTWLADYCIARKATLSVCTISWDFTSSGTDQARVATVNGSIRALCRTRGLPLHDFRRLWYKNAGTTDAAGDVDNVTLKPGWQDENIGDFSTFDVRAYAGFLPGLLFEAWHKFAAADASIETASAFSSLNDGSAGALYMKTVAFTTEAYDPPGPYIMRVNMSDAGSDAAACYALADLGAGYAGVLSARIRLGQHGTSYTVTSGDTIDLLTLEDAAHNPLASLFLKNNTGTYEVHASVSGGDKSPVAKLGVNWLDDIRGDAIHAWMMRASDDKWWFSCAGCYPVQIGAAEATPVRYLSLGRRTAGANQRGQVAVLDVGIGRFCPSFTAGIVNEGVHIPYRIVQQIVGQLACLGEGAALATQEEAGQSILNV